MCPPKHAGLDYVTSVTLVCNLWVTAILQNSGGSCLAPRPGGPKKSKAKAGDNSSDPPTGYAVRLWGPSPILPCSASLLAYFLGYNSLTLSSAGSNRDLSRYTFPEQRGKPHMCLGFRYLSLRQRPEAGGGYNAGLRRGGMGGRGAGSISEPLEGNRGFTRALCLPRSCPCSCPHGLEAPPGQGQCFPLQSGS